ncbi:baseplate assembly protein [Vreelandella hamiltonii]|uniref:Baseplate assembly protein n=1 Tax=Halomonas johnsoniae TaxID=502832 RepID=A0ABQ2WA21_9GAMM|nr:baseplate J/gp47 family protein [Halomonas johnsoniae]GGW45026.1 baseplate assembly protein [Halomonas johnsoniae]
MNSPIDLSQLPAPNVIEPLDYETLLAERKARLIALHPEEEREAVTELLALESEPLVKLLEENAYRELLLRQRINEAARAVMIAFANDEDLDQLGANLNVKRLVLDAGDPTAIPPVSPTLEKNRDYRARIQLAFEGLSVAGPSGAYEYQAISAHPSVLDVSVASPEPVEVVLTVLSREADGQPSPTVLEAVRKRVDERRPLTDRVTVQAATLLPFSITAVLALRTGPDPAVIREQARQQLTAYVETRHRLGAWITRSGVHAALTVEGVERITLEGFSEIIAAQHQAPHCTGITLHTEGV